MTTDPGQLRKATLQARDRLSQDEMAVASEAICDKILKLPEIINSQTIFAYVSFRSEVATYKLIESLLAAGKTVAVPITRVAEKRLDAVKITSISDDLEPGYCKIPEPTDTLCRTNTIVPDTIGVILLPGSVFDKRGGRFGYGGGYYDRFVSNIPDAFRIGLAYDLQIVEKIPLQPHDELLDYVVTPSAVYKGNRK
ncbi:5-formyltetrahydrofolate cyclo-ligase [Desulforhopalus sp. IMCC35007]|uniref:5-formyltetrahydrofolate cyclo-ligase n=1 Tax=Desulforhopalus sp. IMCC35007 TaxID=2569543 RepID=UPI00145F1B90|nr:5-formyltetrahydrofolate cyclo-ligase [Desulforhopalus sp. IMCC35007]